MKTNLTKLMAVLVVSLLLLSACNGSRQSTHHRSVNNSGYRGY